MVVNPAVAAAGGGGDVAVDYADLDVGSAADQ